MSGREIEFLGTLGTGGFGAVYLATVTEADLVRRVAIKVMRDATDAVDDIIARQRDEARLLAMLNHHAIVRVEALFELRGRPAVMMELVDGVDVGAILKTSGAPLPPAVATHVASTVASALDAAWNACSPKTGLPLRVIHRDIKPPNVLITTSGGVKVLDFGIARADFDREGVTSSHAFGTPRYMAPEHFSGGDIGPAYDVYALGVTLYEMASGATWDRPPLLSRAFEAMLDERLLLAPEVLRPTLRALLALEPADRPTAAEAQERLESLTVEGERTSNFARRVVTPLAKKRRPDTSMGVPSRFMLDASTAPDIELSLATPVVATVTESTSAAAAHGGGPIRAAWGVAGAAVGLSMVVGVGLVLGGIWWGISRLSPNAPGSTAAADATPPGLTPASVPEVSSLLPPPVAPVADGRVPAAPSAAGPTSSAIGTTATRSRSPNDQSAQARKELVREATTNPTTPAAAAPQPVAGPPTPASVPTAAPTSAPPVAPAPMKASHAIATRRVSLVGDRRDVTVFVDGKGVGTTPVTADLSLGRHRVEFRYAEGTVAADFELGTTSAATYKCSVKEDKCYWKAQ